MEFDNENSIMDENYYACLNISKDASQDEINAAYRRLSRMYHPDKHVDADLKKKADLLFSKIKKAYEVLSDPHQRAIYDTVGVKGLNTDGWEIVQRTKTPQEIREEYERLERERIERRLQQRTNPRGNVTVSINATDLFTAYDADDDYLDKSFFPALEISGMSISQSIEAPLTLRDTLTLSGNLSTRNGNGAGSFLVACKRLLTTNGWIEGELLAGNGPVASIKLFRTITKTIFGNFATQLKMTANGIKLGFVSSLGMPLDAHTQGYLTWNIGFASSMTTMLVRDTETSYSAAVFSLGLSSSFVSMNHVWKINKADLRLRVYGKVGTANTVVECSVDKKVSEQSSLGAAVSVGIPSGVVLKIKIIRAHHNYFFPIHLCEEPSLIPTVYAVVTPIIVWFAVKKLIVDPFVREQKEKHIERQREINKNKMEEKRREANAAIELMKAAYERIRREEENRNGLIILNALYGKEADILARNDPPGDQEREIIDVVIPLQCLVKNSQLTLHDTSKSQLSGFFDPCVGEDKVLYIQYLYHSHLFETTIKDREGIRIPKQSHRVNVT
ncbi:dnaJ homolog subfamily C member 11 [Planococcus citri]|uniref:dnaJ homolog subfamily C member 11 n=1 Tax=Planococcus citri TaxID=170843 RepID=UPI0031F8830E